jgi:mRNA-degrading endonuclease RelE of RelBE toxin-antitoxin system
MPEQQIAVEWTTEAKANLRAIDRDTALQILYCLTRYLKTRAGNVKQLKPPRTDFRLRCGDYRLFFDRLSKNAILITTIKDRKEAYR